MKKQVDIETEKKAIQEPSLAQDIYFDTTQFKDGVVQQLRDMLEMIMVRFII